MDELVKMVESKTGLAHDQAMAATKVVIDFLKTKLPGPIAAQIDSLLAGSGSLADKAKSFGGILGKN